MRINNNILIVIILFASIITIVSILGIIISDSSFDVLLNFGGGLFILTGAYLLIKNGQFVNSREFRISRIGISIILLGVIFRIMHMEYSDVILAAGCVSFSIIYGAYIIRRIKIINWTNWFKFIFLLLFFLGRYFQWMHWNYSNELSLAALVVMAVLVGEYLLKRRTRAV